MIIREANSKDNQALLDISRTEPMESAVVLYVDRSPDYFYLPGLQGYDSKALIAERNKAIAGVIGISYRDVRLFGKLQRIGYTGKIFEKKAAHYKECSSLELFCSQKVFIEADGEIIGYPPAKYSILKKAIKVIV